MGCCSDGFVDIGCVNYCSTIDTGYDATQTGTHTIEVSLGSDKWNVYSVSFTIGDDLTVVGTFVNEQGEHFLRIKQPDGTYYVFSTGITCLNFTTQIHYGVGGTPPPDPTLCYEDCDAIHDNVASEISAITEKVAAVSADIIIIEDSEDSNNKKKVQLGNVPSSGQTNTASNINTVGEGVYEQKVGSDLQFLGIVAANNQLSVTKFGSPNYALAIDINPGNIDVGDFNDDNTYPSSLTNGLNFIAGVGKLGGALVENTNISGAFDMQFTGIDLFKVTSNGDTFRMGDILNSFLLYADRQMEITTIGSNDIDITSSNDVNLDVTGVINLTNAPSTDNSEVKALVRNATSGDVELTTIVDVIQLACSDLTTDLTTGTSKAYFRTAAAFEISEVRASVLTAPTGATLTVDINEGGVSILSTKITIDISEKTSTTAATPPVISDSSLADDAEITIDIDQIGSTVAGAGLIVTLIGKYT